MNDGKTYLQYLNGLQVQYITGGYFKANNKWNTTEKLKVNKFYYVTDGEFELIIDNITYIVKKGQLVMIPADLKHSYKLTEKKHMKKHWCHFEAFSGTDSLFNVIKSDLIIDIGINKELTDLFKKLYKYEKNPDELSNFSAKAILMLIIGIYLKNCQRITSVNSTENSDLSSVINYMKENINGNITVSELAHFTHLHPNYFIRMFKQYFGSSPIKYFNNMKVNAAKEYLQRGNNSIEEISKILGFSDLYSFSKFFKKNVGISPSQFKSSYIDNRNN